MKKFSVLLLFLSLYWQSAHAFIAQAITDVVYLCTGLTYLNYINNKAVYNLVKRSITGQPAEPLYNDSFILQIENSNNELPIRARSIHSDESTPHYEGPGFSDLAGELPPEVHEIIEFLQDHQKYTAIGAQMPKGVLLVGPPGTGKTSIARAIAQKAQASFFHASGSEFIEKYVGVGPQRVRELFEKARQSLHNGSCKAAIIFIDEIDAIGGTRRDLDNNEYRNTLTELLNQMDGFNQNKALLVIAATNKPDFLDSALKRPGRFDRIVEIGLPTLENRKKIIEHYARRLKLDPQSGLKVDVIAEKTKGYSPVELKNLLNEAAIMAVRSKHKFVTMEHVEKALVTMNRNRRF